MIEIRKTDERVQSVVSLLVQPKQSITDSFFGSAISNHAGTAVYGFNRMQYDLPGGDQLLLFANHSKHHVQIILLTQDPEKLSALPGPRPASLVANTIAQINRYLILSRHYDQPLQPHQIDKYNLVKECVNKLKTLLPLERQFSAIDWEKQETLRADVIRILDRCRDENAILANHPLVSEGEMGDMLYEIRDSAQQYSFNRFYPVSRCDQLDFTEYGDKDTQWLVWDSELHVGYQEEQINDTLRTICEQWKLLPGNELHGIPANRFQRVEHFFRHLWEKGVDWINYLKLKEKPRHHQEEQEEDGLTRIAIHPYYCLEGLPQQEFTNLKALAHFLVNENAIEVCANNASDAYELLGKMSDDAWCHVPAENMIILRRQNHLKKLRYFKKNDFFYPLPDGDDLFKLSQISKRHLYLPERVGLRLKAFVSQIPTAFISFWQRLYWFITHEIRNEFIQHIQAGHETKETETNLPIPRELPSFALKLETVLHEKNLIPQDQSLTQYIETHLNNHRYVIVREEHPAMPMTFNNPLHRIFSVIRHFSDFFVDISEKNPLIGSLALIAYFYGAGAVVAPQALTALLNKLHLHGLVKGIEPTQALGRWMSHGTTSEAISAAVTYWQGAIIAGDIDQFFINAIEVLHDDPTEVAIIISLAIGLGYSLCEAVPPLAHEMGHFPYVNYAALGAKGGAAIYDTVMYPGEDWLLGTLKWAIRIAMILVKVIIGPIVEAAVYGYKKGFSTGIRKSGRVLWTTFKETAAALTNLLLLILTVPLMEVSAMFLHVPFRGLSHLISRSLGWLSHWQQLGQTLVNFAEHISQWRFFSEFRLSPLYGFNWLSAPQSNYALLNVLLNISFWILTPPWQLVKNAVLLPVLDLASVLLYTSLTIVTLPVSLVALTIGKGLSFVGQLWDLVPGRAAFWLANKITQGTNWLDDHAGQLRQRCLGQLQIWRKMIYHWGFSQQETPCPVNQNIDYFLQNPTRLEKLPNTPSHMLMKNLFASKAAPLQTTDEKKGTPVLYKLWSDEISEQKPEQFLPSECNK